MRRIAISLSKGGVGKTTTAVNLGVALAQAGQRVLLVDTDTQGQCATVLGVKPEKGLAAVAGKEVTLREAIVPARPNLWLLGGGRNLAGLKRIIDRKDFGGEQTLAETLSDETLAEAGPFDFLLLDTSPGWDALTVNALFAVEEVLAPVSLEALTLQGLVEFSESLKAIGKYRSQLELRFVVPTFLDRRVSKSDEILELLRAHYPTLICEPIRYNVRLSEAPGHGQSIFEYAPGSSGAKDYAALAQTVLERVPVGT
jgi:chromosome partitioning protein